VNLIILGIYSEARVNKLYDSLWKQVEIPKRFIDRANRYVLKYQGKFGIARLVAARQSQWHDCEIGVFGRVAVNGKEFHPRISWKLTEFELLEKLQDSPQEIVQWIQKCFVFMEWVVDNYTGQAEGEQREFFKEYEVLR